MMLPSENGRVGIIKGPTALLCSSSLAFREKWSRRREGPVVMLTIFLTIWQHSHTTADSPSLLSVAMYLLACIDTSLSTHSCPSSQAPWASPTNHPIASPKTLHTSTTLDSDISRTIWVHWIYPYIIHMYLFYFFLKDTRYLISFLYLHPILLYLYKTLLI